MSPFLTLLPIYIFGNLHCIGMCGPLVLMLGRHRFRHFYFLGRLLSFTLAGLCAGAAGSVLQIIFQEFHISSILSLVLGSLIFFLGMMTLFGIRSLFKIKLPLFVQNLHQKLSTLILQDRPWPVFFFGFFTLALPCGQTVIVYSAIALEGGALFGLGNGLLFALLTSPSLLLAMNAETLLKSFKKYYNVVLGSSALLIGFLAVCRGLADMSVIPHLVLNSKWHIVLY